MNSHLFNWFHDIPIARWVTIEPPNGSWIWIWNQTFHMFNFSQWHYFQGYHRTVFCCNISVLYCLLHKSDFKTEIPINKWRWVSPSLECVMKLQWTRQILPWPMDILGRVPPIWCECPHRYIWAPSPRKMYFISVTSLSRLKKTGTKFHQLMCWQAPCQYRPTDSLR